MLTLLLTLKNFVKWKKENYLCKKWKWLKVVPLATVLLTKL